MTRSPPTFGRAAPPTRARPPLPAKHRAAIPQTAPLAGQASDDVAAELAVWKRERERQPFPLRQVSLILGLCFAAASLVLPERINSAASYVLYALAGISFLSGLARRRKNPS